MSKPAPPMTIDTWSAENFKGARLKRLFRELFFLFVSARLAALPTTHTLTYRQTSTML